MSNIFATNCNNCFNRIFCLVNGSHCAAKAHEMCLEYSANCRKGSQHNYVSTVTKGWTKINNKRNCLVAYQPVKDILELFIESRKNENS